MKLSRSQRTFLVRLGLYVLQALVVALTAAAVARLDQITAELRQDTAARIEARRLIEETRRDTEILVQESRDKDVK